MNSYSVVRPLPVHTIITPTMRAMRLLKKAAFFVALCGVAPGAWAQLYWDSNGTDPGAGVTPTGIWGTDAFWNTLLDGTGATGAWTPGSLAVFSAGTDASGTFTVTVSGTQTATGMAIEEGTVSIAGGAVAVGAGNVTVNSGATLSTDSSLRLTATAGATLNIDGGTLRTTNPGAAGTFIDTDFLITIGAAGATFSHVTLNINNIVQTASVITGPGGLTTTGVGVLSIAGTATYSGPTIITDGELRIRTTADRLPVTTAVTVSSPGILNLNGVSQRIGSLAGNGLVGLGAGTLTVGDAADTTFTGEIRNIANAGASGVATGNGRIIKVGAGSLTLTASNHYSGSLTLSNGTLTAAAGSRLCDVICDVVVHGGTLNLDNESQTILSLAGNGGAINLGVGHILTVNPGNTRTNASAIGGSGSLTKTGTGTLILAGNNTYNGLTAVSAGSLEVRSGNGLGGTAGSTVVGSGATLAFRGGVNYGAAELLTVSGAGAGSVGAINNAGDDNSFGGAIQLAADSAIGSASGNLTLSGVIGDSGPPRMVTKVGAGTVTLTAANNYSGNTLVSGGTLRVANVSGSATGTGLVTVEPGATLTGPGFVAGTLTVNGTISPGSSPGTQNTGSEVWNGGASYLWEINDVDAGEGTDPGWDLINITGGLTINATSGNKFNINITSLTLANAAGVVHDFDNAVEYTWTILKTTTGISGFNAAAFNLDVSGMANNLGNGAFLIELANDGKDLVLHFIDRIQITGQPMNITATQGDMASMSVTATGFTPTYQWRKAGVDLPTETGPTLTFASIQPSHAGNYDVVVSNPAGSVTSTVATVTVLFAPTISVHPQSQTVFAGSNATFSVTAAGNPAPDYRWYRDAVELIGETGSTLTVNNAQPANEGSYTVNVSNSVNNVTSTVATLSLFRDFGDAADPTYPTLLANNGARHLIAPALHLGTNVDAEVDGQPNSTATLDDTTGAPDDEDGVTFLSALAPGQTANVEVVASAAGLLDAWIDFNADGDWADANEQVFTNAVVAAGTNTLTIAVPVDAVLGSTVSRFRLSTAGGLSYTGEALDGEVEDHAVAIATLADLALTKTDSPDPVATGSNLTFTITVTNMGPSGATGVAVTDTLPSGVTFSSAVPSQGSCGEAAGVVTCSLGAMAVNGSATVTIVVVPTASGSLSNYAAVTAAEADLNLANNSASTETTVLDSPVITVQPVGGTGECGGTFMFSVTATGSAPLTYQWKHAGTNLPGATASTLTVTATAETAGAYVVEVANAVGGVTSATATLIVADTTPPMITCAPDATVVGCGPWNFTPPTAMDTCDPSPTISVVSTVTNSVPGGFAATRTWQATDASLNSAPCSQTITVLNTPPTVAVNSAIICAGESVTLTATTSASNPSYLWSPGGEMTASIMVSPTVTTTYTVMVTDGTTTCTGSGSGTVTVATPVVFANNSPITINDNSAGSPYPSTINVSGLTTLVCQVTVSVSGLSHSWPDDIDLLLVGPGGQTVVLMSDAGGGSALSNVTLTFDDTAGSLPDETLIASGTYRPSDFGTKDTLPAPAPPRPYGTALSGFNGTNPNGTWSLYVLDDEAGDLGQIGAWSLAISGSQVFADVAVAKADAPDPVATGSNLTYTVVITNHGPTSAANVSLSDVLPGNVTYISAIASQGSCLESAGTVNCTIGTLTAGQAVTVTVLVSPTALGSVTNSVIVTSTTTDVNLANNSASSITTVLAPPVVTVQPASATVCPGAVAMFTVTATGAAPLSYQWRKGGVDLTGETAATLTINNVQAGNAGSYDVRVSNAVGSTLSAPATLTVLPPTSATPLVNIINICPGATATFSTTASGTGPFSYVWRKDGALLTGETGNSLSFTATPTSGGTYCVEVTGMCNSVTNCATLTVATAPTIATQPQNFNGVQGNSATFSVTAAGTAPFTYQWRYNGANLSNAGQVAGATTTTLTLSSLNCTNEGNFDVIVNNCSGSVTSLVAVLTVRPITAVYFDFETIGQFTNNLPNNGGADPLTPIPFEAAGAGVGGGRGLDLLLNNGTLSDSAFPAMPYDFSVNGRVLRSSVMFKLKAGANNVNDTVIMLGLASKASRLDNGDEQVAFAGVKILGQGAVAAAPATGYQMQLRNKVFAGTGVGTSNATANATLVNGNWYQLSVNFTNIKATIANAFRYNATLVDMGPNGTTPGATVLSTNSTNVVNADLVNDTSVYFDLRMRENAGNDFIDNFSINTADGPAFFACEPRSRTVVRGRPTTINAYIDGTPPFSYQWLKDGAPIPGATDWQYKIAAVAAADAGDYRLQVTAGGPPIVSAAATLTVAPDVTGPVLVSAGSLDGCTIGVCFDEPLDSVSATAPGNYSVTGASVGFVQLRPDGKSVILYISPGIGGPFTVTVNGVKDVYGNTITAGSTASGNVASHLTSLEIGGPLPSVTGNDGIYSCKDGDFDITAGGADVWGNSDQFRFTHQPRTGDFDVRVKIAGQTIPNTVLKAGLMVRENVDAASRTMHAIISPPWPALDRYETGQRTAYAGTTASWAAGGLANGNRTGTAPDSWIRMRRVNNTFTAYAGSNGVDWAAIAQTTQFYPATVLVGLEMVSHVQGRLGRTEFRSFGDFGGYPGAVINITTQPANTNITAGQTASFTVAATVTGAPASELLYQWQRSDGVGGFTNIPSANAANASFTTPALFGLDSNAAFRCVVRVAGVAGAPSNPAVVTVTDAVAPTLLTANVLAGSLRHIVLVFSEPVSAGTADVAGNYNVATLGGTPFTVASAAFFGNANTIVLTTASDLFPDEYRVVINNVQDVNTPPNTIAINTTRTFRQFAAPLQPVVIEMFEDIGNNGTVANLQGQAIYSQGQPTYISYSNIFGHNVSLSGSLLPGTSGTAQDQYGIRAYTHFIPPTNGNYKFWIRGDDGLQLWMNTNGANGTRSAVLPSSTNHPAAEVAPNAIDNLSNTKYLNFDKVNAGFTVTPITGSSIVTGMRFTTANDAPERDPMTFRLEGTTGNPQVGPWTVIVPEISTELTNTLARLTVGPTVSFANATAYSSYRILFPTVRTNATANSMQIAEVEFLNASGRDVTDSGVVLIAENAANVANYGIGSTPANSKTNIALIGGQRYFLEALLREGAGGDGFSVMWTDSSVTTAPANTTFIPATALAYPEGSAPPTPVIAELYTGPVPGATFGGSDLASLATVTNHPKWGNAPDVLVYQKYFAMQPQLVNTRFDNYGGRIYSYFVAPSNGLYRFYLRSDDSSQLYMNTNAVNSTDPAGMVLLGQLTAFTGAFTLVGQNVPLNGGQSYYIEARWKEGTGGDGIAMTFRAQSDTAPPPTVPVPELASPDWFGLPNPPVLRLGPVGLTGLSPSSPVLSEGQTVTLSPVGLSGALPYSFTWLKNGAFVADSLRYTTLPATPADNGAVYTLIVSNAFSRAQASATVTVNIDTTVPTIVSVSSHSYLTNVIVTFSEPIKQATALNAGNYQIAGLTVLGAYADASLRRVSLLTSLQTPGAPYVLMASGLADNSDANNPLAPASVPFNAWQATGCEVGSLQVELFTNMTGVAVANLTSDGRYINNLADSFSTIREFQWTSVPPLVGNGMENYGVRISGHFIAPSNGVYRFYIRSDDASQLFLNSNAVNSTDPAGKVLIAREDTCCKAYGDTTAGGPRVSTGIPLNGGQRYYIEGLLKEGGGGDFFQMAWREAGDPTTPPNNENASGQFFALPPNPVDTTPPQVVRTYSLSGNSVIIEFNEALDATPDLSNPNLDPFNYYISDGMTLMNANVVTVRPDGRSLLLDIAQIGAASYTIQIDNVRDQHCNTMASTTVPGVVFALGQGLRDNTDLGAHNTNPTLTGGTAPMVNPASPGSASAVSPNNLTIIAGGTDMWDNADGMHYTYGVRTGDFDVRVRVESLVPRNNWSKAGLMMRENLTGSSRNLSAIVTPSSPALDGSGAGANDYEAGSRNTTASTTTDWGIRITPVPYPNAWVRLRRIGDTFFAYSSANGVNWVSFATNTTTYPQTVLLGLGTTSHNNTFGQTTTAIYHDYGFILPPTIVDQPDSLTVVSGDTASFSVVAGGTAPFSYQWRFNGGNIANETNATLIINNATVANGGNYDVVVSNMNSSVTSDVAVLTVLALDFGDAPAPYPTLLANNGARHVIVSGFHFGASTTDSEVNGQPSVLADGDDTNGTDDEDGVVSATPFIRGQIASVDVAVSAAGKLDAWIDYNRDGDWADAGERVANNVPLAAGVNTLPLAIPAAAGDGPTYARLRFSSVGGLSYDGLAQDGEVEDYIVLLENTAPIARNDGFGTVTNAPRSIAASALLANDTDANGDTLSVSGVSSSSMRGGTVTLIGATVTYTPPANFTGADFFTYTISDGHGGTATATVCITVNIANLAYAEPIGGWGYIYDGATDSYGVASTPVGNSALDGNWTHGNGSDSWAQETTLVADRPGAGNGLAGGVGSVSEADAASPGGLVTFLRMVDGITAGSTSTDNRRFYFMKDLSTVPGYTPTFMNSGITITFRARLVPDAALEGALTAANKGGMVGADGKGMFGFRQASGDQIVTFSLHTATEDGAPTPAFSAAGLTLNKNVGDAPSAVVGNPSSAAVPHNDLALDPNPWHEFWITVRANDATPGNGTHTATIYMDGSQTPAGVFNFTAGNGDEGTSTTPVITDYLELGQNFTPLAGAFDTDFYGVRMGAVAPGGFNDPVAIAAQPANTTTGEGAPASFNVGVTGTAPYFFQWFDNGVPIPNATNSAYTRVATCADNGRTFHVVVSNFCSQATSASATLTVTSAVPALRITRQGSDVVIAWPVTCETFIVQESISLQPGNIWATASGTASTVGNERRLTIPMSTTENRFYRLRRP
jgi:uncharacterized repeat protein (TIGR01451 family)